MAVFVFKLQSLLDLRAREEQSAQRDLALLMREKAEIDERLRRHQMAIDDGKQALREDLVGMVDVRRLRVQTHAAFGVMRDAQAAAIALAGLARKIEQARVLHQAARAKRRAVEMLKEKRHAEWLREQDRREVALLDELVIAASYARKEWMS
ncbi:MAG TPA: flagellar export protein FliJ [Phycisphaerales bacterium]|nr:flagellar export protein FliJ [Phycisphaerales bacterium]|tara:strand:- start:396 stop:851 length:456 start_codon:yes stop_codon:yes gene_type:complete